MRRFCLLLLAALLAQPALGSPPGRTNHRLTEPVLRLASRQSDAPRVALTLDACSGKVDRRILDMLVEERVPATLFVTARWLKRNADAIAVLKAHPDLFEVEDHGRDHLAAVDRPMTIFGVRSAGSPEALAMEVAGGADAIVAAGFDRPRWFRGATAEYSATALTLIDGMGYRIGGFSLNGDGGSLLGTATTARRIAGARDGDVIIAHVNQPTHAAGAGVVEGVRALKKRGFEFVLLRDGVAPPAGSLHSAVLPE